MPKFQLGAHVTVSAHTEVEADSLEQAIKIAAGRDVQIGGIGTGNDETESWIIEDADGEPQNIHPEN